MVRAEDGGTALSTGEEDSLDVVVAKRFGARRALALARVQARLNAGLAEAVEAPHDHDALVVLLAHAALDLFLNGSAQP